MKGVTMTEGELALALDLCSMMVMMMGVHVNIIFSTIAMTMYSGFQFHQDLVLMKRNEICTS
jgi:hypothetical protein